MKTFHFAVAAAAFLGTVGVTDAIGQGSNQGYLQDSRGAVVKDAFNLCWRTGYWSPSMAIAECDPDLVPRPAPRAPKPAPKPAAPKPAAKPAAPAFKPASKPAARAPAPKRCDATVTLRGDELFVLNKAVLAAAARTRLDKDVIGRIAGCGTLEAVVIEGHTDRLGSQQYNQKLSERRADTIKKYLVTKGIGAAKIETIGMGKTVPAKFCPDTKNRKELIACLAPNRRAIISIKGPAK